MKIAMFHNGPLLGTQIARAWSNEGGQFLFAPESDFMFIENPTLEILEEMCPDLVLLVTDTPSPTFEESVLDKCRDLNLMVLPVLGRASTVLMGPLEVPGQPGCATCLKLRWEHSIRRVRLNSALRTKMGRTQSPYFPLSMTKSELDTLGKIVADETTRILAGTAFYAKGQVGIYRRDKQMEWVSLVPSHACPRCNLLPDDHPSLGGLYFKSHFIEHVDALRVKSVDFDRLNRMYVHQDVGYISSVHELWTEDGYVRASAQIHVPFGASHVGYGSGFSLFNAKQKAMLEVMERICAVQSTNRRPVVWGTYTEFQDSAIHPFQFGVHDDAFYRSSGKYFEPFDEEKQYSWIWAYSTRGGQPILIPEQIAHYGNTRDQKRFVKESSNGCALGGTVEEAVLHGVFEVLERDGFLNMWYAKLPVPELRLSERCPADVYQACCMLEQEGYQVRLFDISHDVRIPAILAVAVGAGNHVPKVVCGASCHLNPHEAAEGALRELIVQVLHLQGISEQRRQEGLSMLEDPSKVREILDHVVAAGLPEAFPRWDFLLNRTTGTPIQSIEDAYGDVAARFHVESRDIRVILNAVLDHLHERGFEVVVVNQTNVEVHYGGLNVVKVIIPGMTPITFGHGCRRVQGLTRVFELPQRMGYASRELAAEDLNQDCHPFA